MAPKRSRSRPHPNYWRPAPSRAAILHQEGEVRPGRLALGEAEFLVEAGGPDHSFSARWTPLALQLVDVFREPADEPFDSGVSAFGSKVNPRGCRPGRLCMIQ